MQVPALIVLGLWFLQQFLFGLGSLGLPSEEGGGVAFWAHAGGFVAGMVLVRLFQRKERRPVARDYWWEAPRYDRRIDRHSRFP